MENWNYHIISTSRDIYRSCYIVEVQPSVANFIYISIVLRQLRLLCCICVICWICTAFTRFSQMQIFCPVYPELAGIMFFRLFFVHIFHFFDRKVGRFIAFFYYEIDASFYQLQFFSQRRQQKLQFRIESSVFIGLSVQRFLYRSTDSIFQRSL